MSKKHIIILSTLLSVVTLLLVLYGVVFCVRKIDVNALNTETYPLTIHILNENNERVKEEESITEDMIVQASGIRKGTPIFNLNKDKIKNNIESVYPSLKVIQIKTISAIRVQIVVRQRVGVYYLKIDSRFAGNIAFYVLDEDLVIIDQLGSDYESEISKKYTELALPDENISTVKTYYDRLSTKTVQTYTSNLLNAICSVVKYKEVTQDTQETSFVISTEDDATYVERETMGKVISKITLSKAEVEDRFKDIANNLYWITIQLTDGKFVQIYRPDKDLITKINLSFSALSELKGGNDTIVCDYQDGKIRLYQKSSN